MIKSEFEKRVQMNVTKEEYAAIEEVYMNSDLDKDEFCKLWVKMNQTRVNKAKADAQAQAKEQAKREKLWEIIYRFDGMSYQDGCKLAADVLSKRQQATIESIGIKIHRSHVYFQTVSEVMYQVRKYLKAA